MLLARTVAAAGALMVATASFAAAGSTPDRADATPHGDVAAAPSPSPPPLPPVSEHAIDPVVLAAATPSPGAAASVTQVVQLTIHGGALSLDHARATVALEPTGRRGAWSAPLPPVRVIDARGTHKGWRVTWEAVAVVADGAAVRARVEVSSSPVVVHGTDGGLRPGHGRTLGAARPGWGGGTYQLDGTVLVRLPAGVDAAEVTITLAYSVA